LKTRSYANSIETNNEESCNYSSFLDEPTKVCYMSHVFVCSFVENVIDVSNDAEIDGIDEEPILIIKD